MPALESASSSSPRLGFFYRGGLTPSPPFFGVKLSFRRCFMLLRLALLLCFATVSVAQNTHDGQISGTVFFKDGLPADHIQIHLQGTRGGVEVDTSTDTQGKFA